MFERADFVLITCVKSKRARPAPARDLYVSPLFSKMRTYAESSGSPWFIVSAEHGLLQPDEWVAPYERYLPDTSRNYQAVWGAWVAARLELLVGELAGARIEMHVSREYGAAVRPHLERAGAEVVEPLAGLTQGARLAWYNQRAISGAVTESKPDGLDVGRAGSLFEPAALVSRAQALGRPSAVPAEPGVYGWWFQDLEDLVPQDSCRRIGLDTLLYVGISPKAPPMSGRPASRQNLRTRITYHFRGNAEGSTLRLTLGCLLAERLGIELRRVGGGNRMTFGTGEEVLSKWLNDHARVSWVTSVEPWVLETELIGHLSLPLNLDQNKQNAFHQKLSNVRATQRARARGLPVV